MQKAHKIETLAYKICELETHNKNYNAKWDNLKYRRMYIKFIKNKILSNHTD